MRTAKAKLATLLVAMSLVLVLPAQALAGYKRVLPAGKHYPAAVERYRPVIRRWGFHVRGKVPMWYQQQALAIIWCESDGNPRSGPCVGIWQFSRSHHANRNAVHDTKLATRLYITQGHKWGPAWVTHSMLHLR